MARLRIIAGKYGGRFINADVAKVTHPMGDRVRSGIFSSLESQELIDDTNVLDAFAGTGAMGLEALSRGAKFVTFIERDKIAQKVIASNIQALQVDDQAKLVKSSVSSWVNTTTPDNLFDLIFCDPPYHNPQFSTVFSLLNYLKNNGLMILSYQARLCVSYPKHGVVVVDNRSYGEAALVVLRKV